MVACQEQHRRIGSAVIHMMVGRIGKEGVELRTLFDGAELGDIEGPAGMEFHAQHVVDADVRHNSGEEFGVLGECRPHQQAAVAAPFNGELFRIRAFPVDQMPGAGGKVIEHVLLVREVAGLVPVVAEFTHTPQIGDDEDSAAGEPHFAAGFEGGRQADAISDGRSQPASSTRNLIPVLGSEHWFAKSENLRLMTAAQSRRFFGGRYCRTKSDW